MQQDKRIDNQQLKNRLQQIESERAKNHKVGEVGQQKLQDDYDIYKQSDKVIRNSSSHKNSLLNKLEPFRPDDVFSQKATKTIRDYKQQLTFLKHPQTNAQFIAYCIVKKQSNSGMFSHERLLLLDSQAKVIKYFSKIPHLPIKSIQEINEHAKEQISIVNSKKFGISLLRSGIGEVEISWVEASAIKKWNIKMGNNQLARDFCLLVENVKNGRHLVQKIEMKRTPDKPVRINKKSTNFIAEVSRLQQQLSNKVSLNHSLVAKIQTPNNEQIHYNNAEVNDNVPQRILEEIETIHNIKQQYIQQQKPIEVQLPQSIEKKISNNLLQAPQPAELQVKESVRSIKIQQIIKQAEEQEKGSRQQEVPQKTPTVTQLAPPKPPDQLRISEIDKILHNRRVLDAEDESIATIKHLNREHEHLGMSKLLVKNIHRKPTNKEEFRPVSKEKYQNPQPKYHRSENPSAAYRQTLLQQRRLTQLPSSKQQQRKTFILNQHSHPRQQKSRSTSKSKQVSKSTLFSEKQWLREWVNANDANQRLEVYSKFIDHCSARVQKLASGYHNWHIFHKQYEQYVIKENGVEYTYQILQQNDGQGQDISSHQQHSITQKLAHFDYLCKSIHSAKQTDIKWMVALACLISYKGLKVFCKAQLASDSLIIQQIHDRFEREIEDLQTHLRLSLKYCSLFFVTSNQGRCIYIHDAEIQPFLDVSKGYYLSHSFVVSQIPKAKPIDPELAYQIIDTTLIPSFLEALHQSPPLTSVDFQSYLQANHLNYSLLPLVYDRCAKLKESHANKWIISELCASFLEQQVRQKIHSYLMRKQANKSLDRQIFYIMAKALRLKDEDNHIGSRIQACLGVCFQSISNLIIEEYTIASLLIRLSLKGILKVPCVIDLLEAKQFDFWKEFEFEEESIHLQFYPQIKAYDYRCFIEDSQQLLQKGSPAKQADLLLQSLKRSTNINKNHLNSSHVYKLLPPSLKVKMDLLQKQAKMCSDNQLVWQLTCPEEISQSNSFHSSKECFESNIKIIKRYIKVRKFQQGELLILSELTKAWIWCKNHPYILSSLYDAYSFLNLQRHSPKAIPCCLKSLQRSIYHYEHNAVSVTVLMEKTFKAAQIHSLFNDLPQTLNFYKACQEIFEKMVEERFITMQLITRYLPVFTNYALILLDGGRIEECITEVKVNLGRYKKWKEAVHCCSYQMMAKIFSEQFENYLILIRCYQLKAKRSELIQVIEECSVKFIENYILVMIENKKPLDITHLSHYRFKQIVKCIWHIIVLNCTSNKVTYHEYFSKVCTALNQIDLNAIKDIVLAIQKDSEGNLPLEQQQAIAKIAAILYTMPTNKLQKISNITMESFLVEICIKCLSALSSPAFLEAEDPEQQKENGRQLELLSCLLSVMGYDFCLGTIHLLGGDFF